MDMRYYQPRPILHRLRDEARMMRLSQQTDGPNPGGYYSQIGLPSGTHGDNAHFIATLGYLYFDADSPERGDPETARRLELAVAFQNRLVAETGLIDLPSANYRSPPDTAFTVQLVAPIVEIARASDLPAAESVEKGLLGYIRTATEGIVDGGFHTPNHRWVVASALAYARSLIPGLPVDDYIASILAESIDINPDGEYSERSTGIYTAVSNRGLMIIANKLDRPELLDHVRASLHLMSRLFHADGSVVTAMSTRQDQGTKAVPQALADIFLTMGHRDDNAEWRAIAENLVAASKDQPATPWLMYPYFVHPELRDSVDPAPAATPSRYTDFYPASGIFRHRDDEFSVTVLKKNHDLLDLVWGPIHLSSVRIAGSYFGRFRFVGTTMTRTERGVRVTSSPEDLPPVGYYLPLGREVSFDEIHHVRGFRDAVRLPQFGVSVDVSVDADGLSIHVETADGLPEVTCQVELCFQGSPIWETAGAATTVGPGTTSILKSGMGTVSVGRYALEVGPGRSDHRTWTMRDTHVADGFRVVVPLLSPIDYTLTLKPGYRHEPTDRFVGRGGLA